jgi:hypothetical protein
MLYQIDSKQVNDFGVNSSFVDEPYDWKASPASGAT